jgi:hypothetical protein
MSRVTNVLVTAGIDEPGVPVLNKWLELENYGVLHNVTLAAGGSKAVEADVWLGAFNYLNLKEFASAVERVKWESPGSVAIFIKEQEDERFELFVTSTPRTGQY